MKVFLTSIKISLLAVFLITLIAVSDSQHSAALADGTATPTADQPQAASGNSFETGGQAFTLDKRMLTAAKSAHLTWIKWQVQIFNDQTTDWIKQTHAAGFKMLFSVVARKNNISSIAEPTFPDAYARYVGDLAKAGADGIEVMNEMNLDREWPTGKIDPVLYVTILSKASAAIRAANPKTLIVSGGLAPTGAESGYGLDRVWNDDHYFQGMVDAGVEQYVDCIGVHYNEGVLPPDATSGDPRQDDYPTHYFIPNMQRASTIFTKPLCLTETGYLTSEGYNKLPDAFSWAQNTTLAQQAQWLAQAATMAQQTGRVRLFIVFNIDFTLYGADPQAGFAMIRADGKCPACDAMAQVTTQATQAAPSK